MNATPSCSSTMPRGYKSEPNFKGPYIAAEVIIALLAIVGNFLVCLAVSQNHKLRTVTNYFLVSLSVADILVGLLAIPCAVMTDLGFPRHDMPLCLLLLSVLMVLTQSSMLSLLAVAAERYVAILLPFQYQRIMSPRNARLALLFTWSLAIICGSVPLMDWHKQTPDADYCIFTCVVDMEYLVYFNYFGCLLVPLVVMFIMYGHIFLTIRRQLRRISVARGPAVEIGRRDAGAVDKAGTGNRTEESRDVVELTRGSIEVAIQAAGTVNESGAETGERSGPEYKFESGTTYKVRGDVDAFGGEARSNNVRTGAEAGAGVEGGARPRIDVEDGTGIKHMTRTKTEARFGDGMCRPTVEGMGGDATGLEVRERVFNRAGVRPEVGSGTRRETEHGRSHGTGLALESSNRARANVRLLIERVRNAALGSQPGLTMGSAGSSSSGSTAVFVIDTCPRPAIEDKPAMRTRQEFRKATSLFLVLFLFMLCWMPIHIINCVLFLCPNCPVPMPLTLTAILLSHANSALNPLLYAYRMRSFRQTLRGMCVWTLRL